MIGATTTLANLLADCDARGIRLLLAGDGGLTIDAPQDALTPELIGRLKAHKADLLRARADVGAGDEPVQIEDNRDELSADNFPGDFNADGWPANTVELLPPCPKCGSLDYWQNLLGDWRCHRCDPPTMARRLAELAGRIRSRNHSRKVLDIKASIG